MTKKLVCVGKFMAPHGIKGSIKIKSYTQDPLSLLDYRPLFNKNGDVEYNITAISTNEDVITANVNDIKKRNEADLLKNNLIYADSNLFDQTSEDEFYINDLIGLEVKNTNNTLIGIITSTYNHGGGDIIEIKLNNNDKALYPFTKVIFPEINITKGYLIFNKPDVENID